jgi:hypothetical protein
MYVVSETPPLGASSTSPSLMGASLFSGGRLDIGFGNSLPQSPTPVNSPTATSVPATATPIPPTATATGVPPTATAIPSATSTRVPPTATPTVSTVGSSLLIKINAGTTAISLPYDFGQASKLVAAINAQGGQVTEVQRWNSSGNGKWDTYKPGSGRNDFNLNGGEGYLVKSNAATTWSVPSNTNSAANRIHLDNGWDMIGVLYCKNGLVSCYSASTLLASMNAAKPGAIVEIDRMVNGAWSAFTPGSSNDFPIVLGGGYYVRSNNAFDWRP